MLYLNWRAETEMHDDDDDDNGDDDEKEWSVEMMLYLIE